MNKRFWRQVSVISTILAIVVGAIAACSSTGGVEVPTIEVDAGSDAGSDGDAKKPVVACCHYDAGQEPVFADAAACEGLLDYNRYDSGGCGNVDSFGGHEISYRGGPVMTGNVNVYFIWYGAWATEPKTGPNKITTLLEQFAGEVDRSSWYAITREYYQKIATNTIPVSYEIRYAGDTVTFVKSTYVGYPHGNSLHWDDLVATVSETISKGSLPADNNGVYFVFTSPDVMQGLFCENYCGWHGSAPINGIDAKISFVGDPTNCLDGCSARPGSTTLGINISPNGDWAADGMVSIFAHELTETITDPYSDNVAWTDKNGWENADKCSWSFGNTYCTSTGARANVRVNGHDYLVQQNWVINNDCGRCALTP